MIFKPGFGEVVKIKYNVGEICCVVPPVISADTVMSVEPIFYVLAARPGEDGRVSLTRDGYGCHGRRRHGRIGVNCSGSGSIPLPASIVRGFYRHCGELTAGTRLRCEGGRWPRTV